MRIIPLALALLCGACSAAYPDASHLGRASNSPEQPTTVAPAVPESGTATAAWEPGAACAYLSGFGYITGNYRHDYENTYVCLTPYRTVGNELPQNNIAYYVEGTATAAAQLKLVLNVNNPTAAPAAHQELAKAAEALTKAAGVSMPRDARARILAGGRGRWSDKGRTVEILRDDWPSGRGYDVRFVVK